MSAIKTIFPPQVPGFLPAFDSKGENPKYYFRPSRVNSIEQISGLHLVISRQDTNANILSPQTYPCELIFIDKGENMKEDDGKVNIIRYDEKRNYYYFRIDKNIFPKSDLPYKVQVRAVSSEAKDRPNLETEMNLMADWLKKNLINFSEWSIVTTMLPITVPTFELNGLNPKRETRINSSGFNFVGSYSTNPGGEREVLSSYSMNLFHYTDYDDKKTWKLIGTTGERTIGINEKNNIQHVFSRELEKLEKYVVSFTIKTKNLYTGTKFYKIIGDYPAIELFNSITLVPDKDEGRIRVNLQAKQILMQADGESKVQYYKDSDEDTAFKYNYANIQGSVSTRENFSMNADDDKWVLQTRVVMTKIHEDIKEAYKHPFITMTSEQPPKGEASVFPRIKLICVKRNVAGYPLMSADGRITEQPSEWVYEFIARKEIVSIDTMGNEEIIQEQNRVFSTKDTLETGQEYYLYLAESDGFMDLVVIRIKERIGGIITWLKCLE